MLVEESKDVPRHDLIIYRNPHTSSILMLPVGRDAVCGSLDKTNCYTKPT